MNIKVYINWIRDGAWLWISLLIILFPILIIPYFFEYFVDVNSYKLTGGILEIFGVLLLANALGSRLQFLKGFSIDEYICDYFRSFPRKRDKILQMISAPFIVSVSSVGKLTVDQNVHPYMDEVIRYFKAEIKQIRSEMQSIQVDAAKSLNKLNNEISEMQQMQIRSSEKIHESIVQASVSDPGGELLGLVTLLMGIIYGNFPEICVSLASGLLDM